LFQLKVTGSLYIYISFCYVYSVFIFSLYLYSDYIVTYSGFSIPPEDPDLVYRYHTL